MDDDASDSSAALGSPAVGVIISPLGRSRSSSNSSFVDRWHGRAVPLGVVSVVEFQARLTTPARSLPRRARQRRFTRSRSNSPDSGDELGSAVTYEMPPDLEDDPIPSELAHRHSLTTPQSGFNPRRPLRRIFPVDEVDRLHRGGRMLERHRIRSRSRSRSPVVVGEDQAQDDVEEPGEFLGRSRRDIGYLDLRRARQRRFTRSNSPDTGEELDSAVAYEMPPDLEDDPIPSELANRRSVINAQFLGRSRRDVGYLDLRRARQRRFTRSRSNSPDTGDELGIAVAYEMPPDLDPGPPIPPELQHQRRLINPQILKLLPNASVSQAQVEDAERCAICIDDFSEVGERVAKLGCQHFFHTECIIPWMEGHLTCPVCRAEITVGCFD